MSRNRILAAVIGLVGLPLAPMVQAAPVQPDPQIVKLVPADIAKAGVLSVGTDATYPPFESMDPASHEIVGFDPDLAHGIASLMGLKLKLVNTSFDSLIPSIQSGKFDLAMSSIGDTQPREEVVDFVTYYWNSSSLVVPKEQPKHIAMDAICGARVGVVRGSLQQNTILPGLMAKCADKTPTLEAGSVFKSSSDAVLALNSGRIDAVLTDAPASQQAADRSEGRLVVVGPLMHNASPGGVVVRKDSGLQPAVLAAVKSLMADGTYKAALQRWDLSAIAINDPVIDWHHQTH